MAKDPLTEEVETEIQNSGLGCVGWTILTVVAGIILYYVMHKLEALGPILRIFKHLD